MCSEFGAVKKFRFKQKKDEIESVIAVEEMSFDNIDLNKKGEYYETF